MGGRIGARMEKAFKKDDAFSGGIGAAHNQTVRNEESVINNLIDEDVTDEQHEG